MLGLFDLDLGQNYLLHFGLRMQKLVESNIMIFLDQFVSFPLSHKVYLDFEMTFLGLILILKVAYYRILLPLNIPVFCFLQSQFVIRESKIVNMD